MTTSCEHKKAKLIGVQSLDFVNAICDDCEESWRGPSYDWTSSRGRLHQVPDWVRRLIVKDPPKGRPALD